MSTIKERAKMGKSNVEKKVRNKLEKIIGDRGIHIVISPPKNYLLSNQIILKRLANKLKRTGIYVTLNMPYLKLSDNLKKSGIDTSGLYFIDGVTKTKAKTREADNCTFIQNPASLTELSLAITAAVNTGKFDFLFLDSLTTLLVYNNLETTEKFSHYMFSKLRNSNVQGDIMSVDEENSNRLVPVLSQFSDTYIAL